MRYFGVVFDGGFALANEVWQIANVVGNHSNIEINEYSSRESAYFFSAHKFIIREYWRPPYRQIPFPKLEDMISNNYIFHMIDYAGYLSPPIRIFAAFNQDYVGVLDNVEALTGFIEQVPFADVRECKDVVEAINVINYESLKYILPFSAYISSDIQRYSTIQINAITPNIFKNWQDTVKLPSGISPQTYLPASVQESAQNKSLDKPDA